MKWPTEFVERTSNLLGAEYEAFERALSQEASISIRYNETKSNTTPTNPIPWCKAGEYLSERPSFTLDPLFHAGAYYVQEPSSMFLSQAILQYANNDAVAYLDLCAAPGGKTTLALQHLPQGSLMVANEIVRSRAYILAENVIKWGNPYHVVLNQTPQQIGQLRSFFDIVAADVPCSGEGMFRKDSEAVEHWSIENVRLCANRQREIVEDIWPSLKPGGVFIYSTCTFNQEENEENIRWMIEELGAESLPIAHDFPQIVSSSDKELHLYRFLPHRTKGEGFSMAVLRKPDTEETRFASTSKKKRNKEKKGVVPIKFPEEAKQWIHQPEGFQFLVQNNRLNAIPKQWVDHVEILQSLFSPLSMGVELGEIKGRDLIPSHALAMSNMLNRIAFPIVELEEEQALDFLRKETISLSEQTPHGFVLCLYKETPIGWVKNIGSRCNNLYPQEWRIRLRKN